MSKAFAVLLATEATAGTCDAIVALANELPSFNPVKPAWVELSSPPFLSNSLLEESNCNH